MSRNITIFVNFNKDSDHKTVDTSELRARFMSNVLSLKEVVLWILSPPFVCCFWSEKKTAVWRCVKALKAKALSLRSTSSSGREGVLHKEQRAPFAPDGVPFNCLCIHSCLESQDCLIT